MIEAWKIGVKIAMTSNAAQVLGVLGRDIAGLGKEAEGLGKKFDTLRGKVLAFGAISLATGGGILAGMKTLLDYGDQLIEQQSKMASAGVSQADRKRITQAGINGAIAVPGTLPSENTELINDLRTILGNVNEAISVAPAMEKVNAYLSNLTGQPAGQAGFEFAKFLEMRGALVNPVTHQIDPEQLKHYARIGMAIMAGTGGRVGPHQLYMFQQQARAAGMSLTDEGLFGMVPLIQAMGGQRAGTALLSAQQQLLGSVQVYSHAVTQLEKIGILDPNKVQMVRGGRYILRQGALKDTTLFRQDPREWVNKVFIPAMQAHGINTMDKMIQYIQSSGLRSTVTGLLVELVRNAPAFAKDVALYHKALGVDQYQTQQNTSYKANIKDFTDAWDGLMQVLGAPLVKPAIGVLKDLTSAVLGMEAWAAKNPGIAKMLDAVAVSLGVLGVAIGGLAIVTVIAAAFNPLMWIIVAVIAVIAGLVAAFFMFRGTITKWFDWFVKAFAAAFAVVKEAVTKWFDWTIKEFSTSFAAVKDIVTKWFDWFPKKFTDSLDWLKNTIVGAFTWIVQQLHNIVPWLVGAPAKSGAAASLASPSGHPAAVPSASGNTAVQLHGDVHLDGKKVGSIVAKRMADQASKPKSGPTGVNVRASPLQPGFSTLVGAGVL